MKTTLVKRFGKVSVVYTPLFSWEKKFILLVGVALGILFF